MSDLIIPAQGVSNGPGLIGKLHDTVRAVKIHRGLLSDLSRQCGSLLSMVREHSPQLAGSPAHASADEIESAVERILKRVSGWAALSDTSAFMKQNEVRTGIEECRRELTTCSQKFTIALSMMSTIGAHNQGQAHKRDHQQLVEMLASFIDEIRQYSRIVASEALQLPLGEPQLQPQVMEVDGRQNALPPPGPVASPSRSNSADYTGNVIKISEQAIIEGSLLAFYHGEWTEDGASCVLGRLRDQSPAAQMRFKERIEASLNLHLHHRSILNSFGYVTIENIVYSVNPWIENGNIRQYVWENPGADRMSLLNQVASGVVFLHEKGIVHGDLCGKNILINGEGNAVVCGFNLSGCSNSTLDWSRARWFAPERITATSIRPPTEEGDIWSFGLLCLEVFTGQDPYCSTSDLCVPVLLSNGATPEHPGPAADGLKPDLWELMQSCWKINPAERPSMIIIQSTIRGMFRRPRERSLGSSEPPLNTPLTPVTTNNPIILSAEPSHISEESSPPPPPNKSPLLTPLEPNRLVPTAPIRAGHQAEAQVQTGHIRSVSDSRSAAAGRLPSLLEDLHVDIPPSPNSAPTTLGRQNQSRPSTAPSPSTTSAPSPQASLPREFRRQPSIDTSISSSQSTSSTGESSSLRRWLPMIGGPKRSQTTPTPSTSDNGDSLPPGIPNNDSSSVHRRVPPPIPPTLSRAQTISAAVASPVSPSRSATLPLPILLPQNRRRELVSPTILEFLEKVASDPEGLLRTATDGSVSAGNLEGLVSKAITGTADSSRDDRFKAAFLTTYQLFSTSERLFEILKRRFVSRGLDPTHARSRFNILLFVEQWLKKGFEDEESTCSSTVYEFVRAISGSDTMEEKAQEIAKLIENPDYVRLRRPGSCTRLRRDPADRPQGMTPADLAAALTVVEGDRFRYITYWDYVNFTRGRSDTRRIEVFNTVHELVTVWVKKTVVHSNDLGERLKMYEEWIYTAQACRSMNNFSSTAAIVIALMSPTITALALTCESRAKQGLHVLARELMPTDGMYKHTLQHAMPNDLIPWLDPLLSSLNSTFARCDPIVEVDGHPLIDFKQCIRLAEQIDTLAQYSPPHVRNATRPEVLAYVESSLKSCTGDDVLQKAEARSAKLVGEERSLLDRRERMRLLGMAWSPHPQKRK